MRRIVISCLVLLVSAVTAQAGKEFRLKSQLLMQDPGIAAAMEQITANPQDAIAWESLGKALAAHGAYEDAEAAFEHGIDIDAKDPDLWVDLGAVRLRNEKFSAGLSAFRKAIDIEPFHALARYNVGVAEQALGHYEEALKAFEDALLLDPNLGDPAKNPGAANNPDLPFVKLRVYLRTTGAAPALMTP
ncbi:MAG: tetratricopeptide repeat protein [Acidobacteria bacterium]|nr:tetratricopeptide repeat protein [Acidobacteriota bacterium]